MSRFKIGLLATHPIQYYAPWYSALAKEVDLKVFYCHRQTKYDQANAGFGVAFDWDIDLFADYEYLFLQTRAKKPDISSFFSYDTPEIRFIIEREQFDAFILHGWANKSYWQAMIACWRNRTPVLIRGDSQLITFRSPFWRMIKYPLYRLFISNFSGYLCVGKRARSYYLHYGAKPERMFFSPHAVDNDFFSKQANILRGFRQQLRHSWKIPDNVTVFLFVGKFIKKKNPEDFIKAIGISAESQSSIWGLMVGDGPLRESLKAMVKANNLPIRFAGFLNQTEITRAYAASDVLVLPSSGEETWGLVVNEAMACGLPVIVSDEVGCAPDLVIPSQTGEIYKCGSVNELSTIISNFTLQKINKMSNNVKQHIKQYSINKAVLGTIKAMEFVKNNTLCAD